MISKVPEQLYLRLIKAFNKNDDIEFLKTYKEFIAHDIDVISESCIRFDNESLFIKLMDHADINDNKIGENSFKNAIINSHEVLISVIKKNYKHKSFFDNKSTISACLTMKRTDILACIIKHSNRVFIQDDKLFVQVLECLIHHNENDAIEKLLSLHDKDITHWSEEYDLLYNCIIAEQTSIIEILLKYHRKLWTSRYRNYLSVALYLEHYEIASLLIRHRCYVSEFIEDTGVYTAEFIASHIELDLYNDFIEYLELMENLNCLHLVYEGDVNKLNKIILYPADFSVCPQVSIYYCCDKDEEDEDYNMESELAKIDDSKFETMFIHFHVLETKNDKYINMIMQKPINKTMIDMKTGKTFAQLYEEYTTKKA